MIILYPMRALFLIPALMACLLTANAAGRLSGNEIKQLFTDATIAGNYIWGGPFSEFHAADGRALGDNGHDINVDACWNTDGDNVCYHYGPQKDRRTYCFIVEREGSSYKLRTATTGALNAIATIEQGNPKAHGDGGRRWSCDDLLSHAPSGRLARKVK